MADTFCYSLTDPLVKTLELNSLVSFSCQQQEEEEGKRLFQLSGIPFLSLCYSLLPCQLSRNGRPDHAVCPAIFLIFPPLPRAEMGPILQCSLSIPFLSPSASFTSTLDLLCFLPQSCFYNISLQMSEMWIASLDFPLSKLSVCIHLS